jgi:hypothetical protein
MFRARAYTIDSCYVGFAVAGRYPWVRSSGGSGSRAGSVTGAHAVRPPRKARLHPASRKNLAC